MPKRNRYPESVLTQVKSTQQPRHEGREKPFTSRAAWSTGMGRRGNLRPWLLLGPMSPANKFQIPFLESDDSS